MSFIPRQTNPIAGGTVGAYSLLGTLILTSVPAKNHLTLVLTSRDKPRNIYSEVRGYSKIYSRVNFYRLINWVAWWRSGWGVGFMIERS